MLLMVQKSCDHQLRLVDYPGFLQGFIHPIGDCLGFLNHQQYERYIPGDSSLDLFIPYIVGGL